jgi:Cdc6-like AAA superfamily ATPase
MKDEERKKLEPELDKLTGEARLFDLHFDKDGCPLPDTFALALNAWASGVILQHGLNKLRNACSVASLSGYEQFDNIKNRLVEYIKDSKQQTGITKEWFNQLIKKVAKECEFPWGIFIKEENGLYLVKALPVYNQNNEAEMNTDDSLINSFFIGELYKVAKNSSGCALLRYLTGSQDQKIDVRGSDEKSQNEVREIIKPQSFPVGCWPSEYPLVFSQQLAVNAIRNEFIAKGILKEGLFAVNGPPGTGKTTLLRDIVAMVVVERARKLCNERKGIFESQAKKVDINNEELEYFPLVGYLRDYSIVVASSNNGAVENVSLELPRMVSVSEAKVKDYDYFRDIATMLLNKNNVKEKAWGLIATNLGRKENRNKFIGTFWATEQTSRTEDGEDIQSEQQIQETVSDEQISSDILQELKSWLSQWEGRWSEVQKELLKWVEKQWQCGKKVLAQDILLRTQKSFEQELQKICELVSLLEQELAPRCEQSPESGTAGNCSAETAPVATSGLSQRLLLLRKGEARPKISREQALIELKTTLKYEQILRKQVETKATENNQLYSQDEETREKSAPFFDKAWFAIRQDLFLAALNLHRALIEEQPDKWLKLLRIVRTWLEGKPLPLETCQHALDALSCQSFRPHLPRLAECLPISESKELAGC